MAFTRVLNRMLAIAMVALLVPGIAAADDDDDNDAKGLRFSSALSGAQEVGPPLMPGMIERASFRASFSKDLSRVRVHLNVKGGGNVVAAHLHCAPAGANGPIAVGLFMPGNLSFDGRRTVGTLTNEDFPATDSCPGSIGQPVNNVAALAFAMREGLIYANVHTTNNPGGEVRGQLLEH